MSKKSSAVDLEIQEILESYFLGIPMSRLYWLNMSYLKKFNRSLDESLGEETIEEHLDVMSQKDMVLLYEDKKKSNNTYVMSARMVENRRKTLKSNVQELLDKHSGAIRLSSFEDIYKKKFKEHASILVLVLEIHIEECKLANCSIIGKREPIHDRGRSEAEDDSHKIWIDPRCCYSLYAKLNPEQVLLQQSPLALPKSLKNPVEMEGLKNAHIRGGAAIVQYFAWMDKQMQEIYGASGYFKEAESLNSKNLSGDVKLTKVSVSDKLEEFRAAKERVELSYYFISWSKLPAIIHYQPEAKTCAELDPNSMYLFDSGAQYLDGTTDITRTVHFGKLTEHEKRCYTAPLSSPILLINFKKSYLESHP
nr:probable Xaa-Pro aminopeptidase P [Tanacetum cinerariifolium]